MTDEEPSKERKRKTTSDDDVRAWGTPRFAASFPEHAELARLVRAFADGDYATVKAGADALAADASASDDVRAAAKILVARTEPDPTAKLLFVFAAGLLVFLTAWWLTHDHAKDEPPRKEPPRQVEVVH